VVSCQMSAYRQNNRPSQYISIHQEERSGTKIRNEYSSTCSRDTVDHFPNYIRIHYQPSPYIAVQGAAIPMATTTTLLEPSIADVITAIEQAAELAQSRGNRAGTEPDQARRLELALLAGLSEL